MTTRVLKKVSDYTTLLSEYVTSDGKRYEEQANVLQDFAKLVENESNDAALLEKRAAKEKAQAEYNTALYNVFSKEKRYIDLQKHMQAKAAGALGANVLDWYTTNQKHLESEKITNSLQKLGAWLCNLHKQYLASKEDAKQLTKRQKSKEEKRAALLAALAALESE